MVIKLALVLQDVRNGQILARQLFALIPDSNMAGRFRHILLLLCKARLSQSDVLIKRQLLL